MPKQLQRKIKIDCFLKFDDKKIIAILLFDKKNYKKDMPFNLFFVLLRLNNFH
jgi:hypothetical protein